MCEILFCFQDELKNVPCNESGQGMQDHIQVLIIKLDALSDGWTLSKHILLAMRQLNGFVPWKKCDDD